MITRWGLIAALTTCAQSPPSGSRVDTVVDTRPASAAFASGSRLEIRWATAIGDRAIAVPLEIFDTKLERVCVINDVVKACVPQVDRRAPMEAVAFLDGKRAHPALLADPSECDDPTTTPDGTLWAVGTYTPQLDVFTARSARTVDADAIWIAGGTGCGHVRASMVLTVRAAARGRERPRIRRGERGRAPVRVLPSGESVAIGLYDTKLGRDCVAKRTSSGTLRCVVDHRRSCQLTRRVSSDGKEHDVLASDPRFENAATRCMGGVVRIEAIPDSPPTTHGIDPHANTIAGTKERFIRFATVSQLHDHVAAWIPEYSVQTYDALEELDETAFAALEVARDP